MQIRDCRPGNFFVVVGCSVYILHSGSRQLGFWNHVKSVLNCSMVSSLHKNKLNAPVNRSFDFNFVSVCNFSSLSLSKLSNIHGLNTMSAFSSVSVKVNVPYLPSAVVCLRRFLCGPHNQVCCFTLCPRADVTYM